jgi:hypothetical protein
MTTTTTTTTTIHFSALIRRERGTIPCNALHESQLDLISTRTGAYNCSSDLRTQGLTCSIVYCYVAVRNGFKESSSFPLLINSTEHCVAMCVRRTTTKQQQAQQQQQQQQYKQKNNVCCEQHKLGVSAQRKQ